VGCYETLNRRVAQVVWARKAWSVIRTKSRLGVVAVLLIGAVIALIFWSDRTSPSQVESPLEEPASEDLQEPAVVEAIARPELTHSPEPIPPEPVLATTATVALASMAPVDEDALMTTLRELGQRDPEQSIQLAREGNRRFPKGSGASERAWIVCKSLTNLARFDQAREEAQRMAEKYPGDPWTVDVIKHILIQPGTHPSQRGYGKELEGE
jgi:hypothetical protein